MSDKQVAVLLSAYNGEKYIEIQVESILQQKGIDSMTIFIRDDGSKDSTLRILDRLQKEHSNIEVIFGQNIGLVASFLMLLGYAYEKGYDYYSFSDQDDYWLPDKLCVAIKAINGFATPCMYSSCSKIADDELNPTGQVTQKKLKDITFYNSAIQNFCPGHNQLINRTMAEIILKHTSYCHSIYSQDLWITNVAALTGTIIFDNTPHTLYRQHENNQLSFGKSKVDWFTDHIKRLRKNEGKKIAVQLKYFVDCYGEYLTDEQKAEIQDFFDSEKSFFKRVRYVAHAKMYRQRSYETPMFKMIYVMGGYNIDTL